jgi:hypothetical protein
MTQNLRQALIVAPAKLDDEMLACPFIGQTVV